MKILKSILAIALVILMILCLFSCKLQPKEKEDKSVAQTEKKEIKQTESVYEDEEFVPVEESDGYKYYLNFLKEFEKEGLKSKGIDIEPLLDTALNGVEDVTSIKYEMQKCSITDNKTRELILKFEIDHKQYNRAKDLLCIYTLDNSGRYALILCKVHNFLNYELTSLLGNDRLQIILFTDDTGNNHTRVDMQILSYNISEREFDVVFDEVLCAYAAFPFEEGTRKVSYDNKYEFVDGSGSAKDIIFTSEIYEDERIILQRGSSRFVYNGSGYVANPYYDYHSIAKEIHDNKK